MSGKSALVLIEFQREWLHKDGKTVFLDEGSETI